MIPKKLITLLIVISILLFLSDPVSAKGGKSSLKADDIAKIIKAFGKLLKSFHLEANGNYEEADQNQTGEAKDTPGFLAWIAVPAVLGAAYMRRKRG